MRHFLVLAFSITASTVACPANAQSEAPPSESPPPTDSPPPTESPPPSRPPPHPRELNGHAFIPSNIITDPFTATWFNSQTGFGYLRANVEQRDENGMPNGNHLVLALVPFTQGFGAQIGVLPRYWALRVSAAGIAIPPVSLDGALDFGAQAGYEVKGGTTLSFRIGRFLRLGGAFDVVYDSTLRFNIVDAIVNSINAGKVNASTLLITTNTGEILWTASAALGLHPALGLVLSAQYGHSFSTVGVMHSDDGEALLGATLDLDLKAVSPIPIGLLGAYKLQVTTSDSSPSHNLSGGFYYTGRRNLLLGVETQVLLPPGRPTVDLLFVYGIITLRYYW